MGAPEQMQIGGLVTDTSVADAIVRKRGRRRPGDVEKSLEEIFAEQLRENHAPPWAHDVFFANKALQFAREGKCRMWRFDFCWHQYQLAVEVEGLAVQVLANPKRKKGRQFVVSGRHGTVDGIQEDMDKYNAALELGWGVLRYSPKMVKSGVAIRQVLRVLRQRGWGGREK